MTETAVAVAEKPLDVALLKAVGLDRLAPEQRQLALNIAQRYELDLLMKHLVMIEGRPYITRDGLLHVAHRSGQLDGMQTSEPTIVEGFWRSTCSVFRKDMSHPFTYTGRYPTTGGNAKFAPEMAVKVGEVMALRRAFDVAAPTAEERWDVEVPAVEPAPKVSLAERAKAAVVPVSVIADDSEGMPEVEYPHVDAGLSLETFADLCRKAGKKTQEIASAIECVPSEVGKRVEAMTPVERGVLADELNLDWRGPA